VGNRSDEKAGRAVPAFGTKCAGELARVDPTLTQRAAQLGLFRPMAPLAGRTGALSTDRAVGDDV